MAITTDHVTGFFVGLGMAVVGFYLYRRNQSQVDDFLRKQGLPLSGGSGSDRANMTLEELVGEKEGLEDLIAERETGDAKEKEKKSSS